MSVYASRVEGWIRQGLWMDRDDVARELMHHVAPSVPRGKEWEAKTVDLIGRLAALEECMEAPVMLPLVDEVMSLVSEK